MNDSFLNSSVLSSDLWIVVLSHLSSYVLFSLRFICKEFHLLVFETFLYRGRQNLKGVIKLQKCWRRCRSDSLLNKKEKRKEILREWLNRTSLEVNRLKKNITFRDTLIKEIQWSKVKSKTKLSPESIFALVPVGIYQDLLNALTRLEAALQRLILDYDTKGNQQKLAATIAKFLEEIKEPLKSQVMKYRKENEVLNVWKQISKNPEGKIIQQRNGFVSEDSYKINFAIPLGLYARQNLFMQEIKRHSHRCHPDYHQVSKVIKEWGEFTDSFTTFVSLIHPSLAMD